MRLAVLKVEPGRLKVHWAAEGTLDILTEMERLIRRTEQIRDAVRFARSDTEGVLEALGVPAERPKGRDDPERGVLDALAWLDAQGAFLRSPVPDRGRPRACVRALERALADLAAVVARRHDYLLGLA